MILFDLFKVTKFQIFNLKVLMMNTFFANLAWIFYRFLTDIYIGTYFLHHDKWWISIVPIGIFVFGYYLFFILDVVAYNYELNLTFLPYIVFIVIFSGILIDKSLYYPPTISGLFISCILTMIIVTFLQKLGIFMYYFIHKYSCNPRKIVTKSTEI